MHLVHYGKALAPSIELYKWIVRITFLVKRNEKQERLLPPHLIPVKSFSEGFLIKICRKMVIEYLLN